MTEFVPKTGPEVKGSWLNFQNSQGLEVPATLLRIDRHRVVFEVYNPDVVLRTSEVLAEVQVVYQEKQIYSGKAVVQSMVSTGQTLVCEALLEDAWTDNRVAAAANNAPDAAAQFSRFMTEWQKLYRVQPLFKVAIADLESFLDDLRMWLNQLELGIRSSPSADRVELEKQIARGLEEDVVKAIRGLFDRLEMVAQRLPVEEQSAHWAFGKRHLHPLLLSSPFVYRTLRKPLGYAGDYEMVNMMFRDACEGGSLFAKLVNMYALRLPPILSHRSRIAYLTNILEREAAATLGRGETPHFYSLGCGPAHEVQTFLERHASDRAHFTLVDFNEETLRHLAQKLDALKKQHRRTTGTNLVRKSVQSLLKESVRKSPARAEKHTMVYCAGLFDYLTDRVCRQLIGVLYEMLAPGGLLVVTNVDSHPSRAEMECFLEWHLIYRNSKELRALVPAHIPADEISHVCQDHSAGNNLFLEIRKGSA